MATGTALAGYYDSRLVVFSVMIAMLAAYAALDLGERVTTAHGGARVASLLHRRVAT
jgi:NO-binding membrane sensor protein with MHYT domain